MTGGAVGGGCGGRPGSIDMKGNMFSAVRQSNSNWTGYDRNKFALSFWYYLFANRSLNCSIYGKTRNEFNVALMATGQLRFATNVGGPGLQELQTTATFNTTSTWYHVMVHFDMSVGTPNERHKIWVDGTQISSFAVQDNVTGAPQELIQPMAVGSSDGSESTINGLVYQPAFFSGSLPSINDVYDSGSPVDVSNVAGLYSLISPNGPITSDKVLSTSWTKAGDVARSTTTP